MRNGETKKDQSLPMQSSSESTDKRNLETWEQSLLAEIEGSYAHNSRLYSALEKSARGEEIHRFYAFDAHQPPFYVFLQRWVPRAEGPVKDALLRHIEEEITEEHSRLFQDMMKVLAKEYPISEPEADELQLQELNYVFSEVCAREQSLGYFCGCFLATEVMSAKRCTQALKGLRRIGFPEPALRYLIIHAEADASHADLAMREFIRQFVTTQSNQASARAEVEKGLRDRLRRSENFIRWYESKFGLM